jgi:histone chaperone ASF1
LLPWKTVCLSLPRTHEGYTCVSIASEGTDPLFSQRIDLGWRLIYVSSPGNEGLNQELDNCLVGPVPGGITAFEFEGCTLDPKKIPKEDVLGMAALILTGGYKEQEYVRVGYYQNTEWEAEDGGMPTGTGDVNPDNKKEKREKEKERLLEFDKLVRDINGKPRATRFQIKW